MNPSPSSRRSGAGSPPGSASPPAPPVLTRRELPPEALGRAQGSLLSQLSGDALGSQVEFLGRDRIAELHPGGVREIGPSPVWGTLAGQPTDDSEMALALARSIVRNGAYSAPDALSAYRSWRASDPFDCGATVGSALAGAPLPESQANGAMMRASPLGIAGAGLPEETVALQAVADASLTHPNPVTTAANSLFARAIAHAVEQGLPAGELYSYVLARARGENTPAGLLEAVERAADGPPGDFAVRSGWVLIAFRNALWRLASGQGLAEALADTAGEGGDADTNCAICGALLGAVHGLAAVPVQWAHAVLTCFPRAGTPGVARPRPAEYWPAEALYLAGRLIGFIGTGA
ncbi:MAG: ADP-ribosylglycohydrolase family protein [Deltaproteobacteria bacterium]|nr:ADP-ribosylglycohydrolase family protein [Deltaproteobacteria bacterium]